MVMEKGVADVKCKEMKRLDRGDMVTWSDSETLLYWERTAQAHFLAIAEFSLFPNDEFTKGNKGK